MKKNERIFPAEWHVQSGVQLTWPHIDTDWQPYLEEANVCFGQIANAIAKREKLLIVCPIADAVGPYIETENLANVRFVEMNTNDTWARDHAGVTIFENGKPLLLDFTFNGWGLKFAAHADNAITRKLFDKNAFDKEVIYENQLNFIFEGGGIESDGLGTLLTTSECLLSPNRNGGSTREEIETFLLETLGGQRMLWLDHGYLSGDDTDSHIDTLARFCSPTTIAYVKCDDSTDEHFTALKAMETQLKTFVQSNGQPYELIPLPMAEPVFFEGDRLPATYANFLIINNAVLVPTYNQKADKLALATLAAVFPDREVVGIDCSVLIKQHGSLHCVTMQYPEGVLL